MLRLSSGGIRLCTSGLEMREVVSKNSVFQAHSNFLEDWFTKSRAVLARRSDTRRASKDASTSSRPKRPSASPVFFFPPTTPFFEDITHPSKHLQAELIRTSLVAKG